LQAFSNDALEHCLGHIYFGSLAVVIQLVGVCAVSGTSSATIRDF